MSWTYKIVLIFFVKSCYSVILHLNDTEYEKMPAIFSLDDYYRCLMNNGTYCIVKFDLVAEPNNQLMDMIQGYSEFRQKHFNYSTIDRGICLSERCRKYMVKGPVGAVLERCEGARVRGTHGLGARAAVVHSCDTRAALDSQPRSALDWLVAALVLLILALNLYATAYDYIKLKNKYTNTEENSVLLSFSISRNWKWLVSPGAEGDLDCETLRGFHGIKAVCSFFVVLPHVFILFVQYIDNPRYLEMTYETKPYYILYNGLTMVQIFFVISGFLLVYNLEQKFENKSISWALLPKLVFYRWWRLTPAYALVIAFTSTWLRHAGSGPMWQSQVVDLPVAHCRQHWWKHLLYFHNYESRDTFCMMPSWHIAADAQLFVVGAAVHIASRSRGRDLALALLFVLGTLIPAYEVWRMNIHPVVVFDPETFRQYRNDVFFYFHNRGHNNIPCFVIGMFCARLVRRWSITNAAFAENKFARLWTWFIVPAILLVFMTGEVFYETPELLPMWFRMAYAASLRVVVGVMVGFGIVALTMNVDTPMSRFWKWRGWVVPGRLSYGVFLVHMNIIHYMLGTRTYLMHITSFNLTAYLLGVFLASLVLALPLHLLVEAPMNQLLRVLTSGALHKQNSKQKLIKYKKQ